MSEIKQADANPLEVGEISDQSLSDSWTVLDSSHFKEDCDSSDAESVEVLPEEIPVDDISQGNKFDELAGSCSPTILAFVYDDTKTAATSAAGDNETPESTAAAAAAAAASAVEEEEQKENERLDNAWTAWRKAVKRRRALRKRFLRGYWNDITVKAFGESLGRLIFEISLYSLVIDVVFLTIFGLSSLSCLVDHSSQVLLKSTKSYQQYEMDPLSLQLSHVLAEWKKQPHEDHSLNRHLLKTLLLYFGGSTELSANLHALTERIQKHNEAIGRFGNEKDGKNVMQHHRMIVSGHLAHSVACLLGKLDNDKSLPAELFTTVKNDSNESNAFAPEPGFWLNDWHLPQYFKANDTYYRIDTKPILPPMRNLFLHLGSAKWNHYFWKLYQEYENGNYDHAMKNKKKKLKEGEYDDDVDDDGDRDDERSFDGMVLESELEGEETERSPLDATSAVDFVSVEESSGNVNLLDNPEERVGVLYPLFVNNLDSGDSDEEIKVNDSDDKFEEMGQYFEILEGDYSSDLSQHSRYECVDGGCHQLKKINEDKANENGISKNSKLSELFHEEHQQQEKAEMYRKKLSEIFNEYSSEGQQEQEIINRMSNEASSTELLKERKTKTKKGIRKNKYRTSDLENSKGKSKEKKKDKHYTDFNGKKKPKFKNGKKKAKLEGGDLQYVQLEDNILREQTNEKKRFADERFTDWNTRMVQGREKLRALSEEGNNQIWVFERARARRDLRDETFAE